MRAGSTKKALAGFVVAAAATTAFGGAAFATKNTGGYQRSSEGIKHEYVDPCPGIWKQFEQDVNSAEKAQQAGNTQSMGDFLNFAKMDLQAGQKAGCDWAAEAAVPTLTRSGPTPVGTIRAA